MEYLYHYTNLASMRQILESGALKLTPSNLLEPKDMHIGVDQFGHKAMVSETDSYKPVVWLTNSDSPDRNGIDSSVGMPDEYVKKRVRFVLEKKPHYEWWHTWSDKNRMKKSYKKRLILNMPECEECNAYRIDYKDEDGFVIWETEGERPALHGEKAEVPFRLSHEERQLLRRVILDTIPEEADSIQVYAERMFEIYEEGRFMECPPKGLADIYSYMDIRRAQFFTAAAITQLFIDAKLKIATGKNMVSLLDAIQTLPLNLGSPFLPAQRFSHPLEHHRNLFLQKLSQCTQEKAEEIRGIAWVVVHKYAKRVYNLDFGVPDDEYLG